MKTVTSSWKNYIYSFYVSLLKEEQHANTSANYDVELLHHKEAHVDFLKSGK